MYFDKRSPLINYIAEDAIVYSTAIVAAVAREKNQTTASSNSCQSFVICGTPSSRCCNEVRLRG
jgi:hypothetical protein